MGCVIKLPLIWLQQIPSPQAFQGQLGCSTLVFGTLGLTPGLAQALPLRETGFGRQA